MLPGCCAGQIPGGDSLDEVGDALIVVQGRRSRGRELQILDQIECECITYPMVEQAYQAATAPTGHTSAHCIRASEARRASAMLTPFSDRELVKRCVTKA